MTPSLSFVEAMLSKIILMMPKTQVKNQESSKFLESKSRSIKARFKNQRVFQSKQVSRIKESFNQDSFNQESRFK